MNTKKEYQRPETNVIRLEAEGEVFVLSGRSPGADKNPGDISVGNSSFFSKERFFDKED